MSRRVIRRSKSLRVSGEQNGEEGRTTFCLVRRSGSFSSVRSLVKLFELSVVCINCYDHSLFGRYVINLTELKMVYNYLDYWSCHYIPLPPPPSLMEGDLLGLEWRDYALPSQLKIIHCWIKVSRIPEITPLQGAFSTECSVWIGWSVHVRSNCMTFVKVICTCNILVWTHVH